MRGGSACATPLKEWESERARVRARESYFLLKGATPSKADHSTGATPSMNNRASKSSRKTAGAAAALFHGYSTVIFQSKSGAKWKYLYSLTMQLVPKAVLTSKLKLRFGIRSVY